jgi:hypothetical protein
MKRHFLSLLFIALTWLCVAAPPSEASAQSTSTYSAGAQWGTSPGGMAVNGAYDSALAHSLDGQIAGQVNAAKVGGLMGLQGTSLSIQSIGSQSVTSNSISGQNITSSINATQTSSDSGSVTNSGTITPASQ